MTPRFKVGDRVWFWKVPCTCGRPERGIDRVLVTGAVQYTHRNHPRGDFGYTIVEEGTHSRHFRDESLTHATREEAEGGIA